MKCPPPLAGCGQLVAHSCDRRDVARFGGKQILIVGGGHSAVEYAALLHDAGAAVHVVARRPIEWRSADRDVCAGKSRPWLDRLPYAFHHMPPWAKRRYNRSYSSGVSDSLRERIIGKVALHERQTILAIDAKVDAAIATISDGSTLRADHVMLATGYFGLSN